VEDLEVGDTHARGAMRAGYSRSLKGFVSTAVRSRGSRDELSR
jgi:hypothetical protein